MTRIKYCKNEEITFPTNTQYTEIDLRRDDPIQPCRIVKLWIDQNDELMIKLEMESYNQARARWDTILNNNHTDSNEAKLLKLSTL